MRLLEIATQQGGLRALSRRLGRPNSESTISRHISGARYPGQDWLDVYDEELDICPDWFEQEPTRRQLAKFGGLA